MPGAVGGDAFKMYYAVDHAPPGRRLEAATTVAVDRVIGLGAMFILVAASVSLPYIVGQGDPVVDQLVQTLAAKLGPLGKPFAVFLLIAGVLALGMFHGGVRDWAIVQRIRARLPAQAGKAFALGDRMARSFVQSVRSPGPTLVAVLLSCAAHIATVYCFFVLGRAIGETSLGFGRYVMVVPIGLLVNAIPGSPGGLGIGENAYEALFAIVQPAGAPALGAEICVLWRLVTFFWNLLGGIAYVLHRRGEADPALLQSDEA